MDDCGGEKARIRFIVAPDFHKLRVENNMPTPPDYETTRKVYFYLLDHTELDGRVPVPLRRIATDMERAWSTIRWHILHLAESGLIFKSPDSNHMKRTIYIRDMEMKDPEKVFQNISAFPVSLGTSERAHRRKLRKCKVHRATGLEEPVTLA